MSSDLYDSGYVYTLHSSYDENLVYGDAHSGDPFEWNIYYAATGETWNWLLQDRLASSSKDTPCNGYIQNGNFLVVLSFTLS